MSRLAAVLDSASRWTIAVSGGVDSLTLASFAHRLLPGATRMVHAASAAVPREAQSRLEAIARAEGWELSIIDAGELSDPDYRANPINRCFYCKSALYRSILGRIDGADGAVASGTNLDDLGDFRPGLAAARAAGVRHPYIEAGLDKAAVRALARDLGLDCAEIPAQPCLSSRIETGLRIDPADLVFIDATETALRRFAPQADLRVRIRPGGVSVELSEAATPRIERRAHTLCRAAGRVFLGVVPYRRGSAFIGTKP